MKRKPLDHSNCKLCADGACYHYRCGWNKGYLAGYKRRAWDEFVEKVKEVGKP